MHYGKCGSKPGSLDESTYDGLEKPPRVKASDIGFHAPEYVLDDIISITDPRLIYSNVHAQRDRRLRLLIRRYTNQIQFGCRNVNCTTPTCLSYRKRNSTVPLRKYTDLSARTLACQLVEEYSHSSKDPALGLCQNEPVVPWYEDPTLAKRRRNSHEKPTCQRQENGHAPEPLPPGQRIRESPKASPVRNRAHRGLSQDRVTEVARRIEQSEGDLAEGVPAILNEIIPGSKSDSKSTKDIEVYVDDATPPPKQRDYASFTQALFDLMPLRNLNWLSGINVKHNAKESEVELSAQRREPPRVDTPPDDVSTTVQEANSSSQNGISRSHSSKSRLAYALTTLTWNTMVWLLSEKRKADSGYHENLAPFIRQTFSYCLSDPERLVRTVNHVHDSYRLRGHRVVMDTPSKWPVTPTQTDDDVSVLLLSLSFMQSLDNRELVMMNVWTAMQHCYSLPLWLRQRHSGSKSRSGSANGDAKLSKRQRASARTNTGSSYSSIPIAPEIPREVKLLTIQLDEPEICELCFITLVFLVSTVFDVRFHEQWRQKSAFQRFILERDHGTTFLSFPVRNMITLSDVLEANDILEDWSVHRLIIVLMDIISHRLAITKWARTVKNPSKSNSKKTIIESLVARLDRTFLKDHGIPSSWIGTASIELIRNVMRKDWDRSPIIQRSGPVAGALELLAGLYRERQELNLSPDLFWMPFIAEIFDDMTMPAEWLSFRADNRQMHLLSFSFLFRPDILVKYFRAINIAVMKKSHEDATIVCNDTRQYIWATLPIPIHGAKEVLSHLRPHMAKYFVLTIRRGDILNDAIDQIWRRQRREIMRPLRVRIGKDEGEDGLDHGGVQQEFFRLVFAEAFRPDYGMFTVDSTTRMTWFQPGSFEPLFRFEALGILMSLAVYNGITLPVTMPLAFYRKLLGLKVKKFEHIVDGWPELAKGLLQLVEWSDGDVGDVIARTYEFSYEICGKPVSVDMQKIGRDDPWPATKLRPSKKGKEKTKSTSFELPLEGALTPPSQPSPNLSPSLPTAPILSRTSSIEVRGISTPQSIDSDLLGSPVVSEAALVTNENRIQYVKDYILWLTHKSIEPQYEAFARGFYTCLDRTALSIFTPEALKALVEGYADIDIAGLERSTTYDDYTAEHPTIVDFWHVVRNMSPAQHKQLLEFVTASDRVPVNGIGSVTFIVQKNGEEDSRLPSSSTCYGRLLLPQYSSRKVLEEKLTKAIENSVGFGTL